MELVKVNPTEFGLTDETAKNIRDQFQPMLDKMVELENEFNQITSMPVEDPITAKQAKELLMKYVKVRTGTAEIHKQQKAFYLNGGRFVDAWKNTQLFASGEKENKLSEIVNYQANIERLRIEKLEGERIELIRPYVEDAHRLGLGNMKQDVFDAYLASKIKAHNDLLAAQAEAERIRVENEKREAEEREAQRLENERLKKEAEKRELQILAERKAADEKLKAQAEAERKERERLDKIASEKLAQERKEREKLEAELRAKEAKEAADKKEAERIALAEKKSAEKLAKAPVKKQLSTWVASFELPKTDVSNEVSLEISKRFDSFKSWANTLIDSI